MKNGDATSASESRAIRYWATREPWQIALAKRSRARKQGLLPHLNRRIRGRAKNP